MNDQMLATAELYLAHRGPMPLDLDKVGHALLSTITIGKSEDVLIQLCKHDFSRAFREQ